MKKIIKMNREVFYSNFLMAIREISEVDEERIRIKIIPIYEKGKSYNAIDDSMRLVALGHPNIGKRLLTIEETVNLMTCKSPLVPIWINIIYEGEKDNTVILRLETSLRFRKPSLLRNVETGHPPFRVL